MVKEIFKLLLEILLIQLQLLLQLLLLSLLFLSLLSLLSPQPPLQLMPTSKKEEVEKEEVERVEDPEKTKKMVRTKSHLTKHLMILRKSQATRLREKLENNLGCPKWEADTHPSWAKSSAVKAEMNSKSALWPLKLKPKLPREKKCSRRKLLKRKLKSPLNKPKKKLPLSPLEEMPLTPPTLTKRKLRKPLDGKPTKKKLKPWKRRDPREAKVKNQEPVKNPRVVKSTRIPTRKPKAETEKELEYLTWKNFN
jgi:hypothetical protein